MKRVRFLPFCEAVYVRPVGCKTWNPVVTAATRAHERACAQEYTWPALPAHLRALPDARAMVRHWVRTDYHWTLTTFVNNG